MPAWSPSDRAWLTPPFYPIHPFFSLSTDRYVSVLRVKCQENAAMSLSVGLGEDGPHLGHVMLVSQPDYPRCQQTTPGDTTRHGPVSATWTQTVASVEIGSVSWNFRSLVTASSLSWPRSRDTSYVMTRWRCSGHSFRICRGGSRNGSWRKSWQSRKSPPSHPAISTRSVSAPRAPSKIGTSRASPLLPRPSSFFVSSLSHRRDAIKEAAAFNSPSVEWCYQFSARAPIVNNPTLLFEVAPSASLCHLGFQLTEISSLSSFLFCVLLAAPRQDETSFI